MSGIIFAPPRITAEADIAGAALSWDGTPPSSLSAAKYRWWRFGALVSIQFRIEYGGAGTANTTLTMTDPFPDTPLPWFPTGTGASEIIDAGTVSVHGSATGLSSGSSRGYIRRGASSRYDMLCLCSSLTAVLVTGTMNYITDN